MPAYDYGCTACGRRVEVRHAISETGPTTCEVCGGQMRKLLSPPTIVFKGSGWAKKDAQTARSGAKGGSAGAEGGSDSGDSPTGDKSDGGGNGTDKGSGSTTEGGAKESTKAAGTGKEAATKRPYADKAGAAGGRESAPSKT